MKYFFVVLEGDREYVMDKISELKRLEVPYIIICGGKIIQK